MQPLPGCQARNGSKVSSGDRTVSLDRFVWCGNLPDVRCDKNGLKGYISKYHRDLMLARNNIFCDKESASKIKLNQLRGQLPASRIKYKDAIEACRSMEYIELNVSQIARQFSLEGSNWGRQLRTHCFEKGFYEHLQRWHLDLICKRKNISYEEGQPVDWSQVRKYNPAQGKIHRSYPSAERKRTAYRPGCR